MAAETAPAQLSKIEKQHFRRVCSKFASGITVATVLDSAGKSHGLTANSFTSVSLTPPLLLICVDHRSALLEHFRQNDHFGINILHQNQRHLSERFAGSGYDRFEGVNWYAGETGVPLLPDVLATIECRRVNLVTAGDHDIIIGEVVHANCCDGEPLLYFGSQYRQLQ
ncbi:MAG TPA: flavin reductase family protein [Bryobacteraceae bacterium]|nr:flavin reductase family protein [Bryobacteraceae bacterium]